MNTAVDSGFRNLYLHIPFCSGKCLYCGFYSERYSPRRADAFLSALDAEIADAVPACRPAPSTLYIGGGTPSVLSVSHWSRLMKAVRRNVDLDALVEWTVEACPESVQAPLVAFWAEQGVTRVNLGVQSLDDDVLARMNRRHRASDVPKAATRLRQGGIRRVGLDLIACLPGMNLSKWRSTVRTALQCAPEHMAVYACSVEPGSGLERLRVQGAFHPADDIAERKALDAAADLLAQSGFEHYEISNWARPGERCRYNVNVWNGEDYRGFGPAAASRTGRRRWTVTPDLDAYLAAVGSGRFPRTEDQVSPAMDAAERLMFRFRLTDAVHLDAFANAQGAAAVKQLPFWRARLEELAEAGLVSPAGGGWRRTSLGARMADRIAEALLPEHDPDTIRV